jgi:hypothetical protein
VDDRGQAPGIFDGERCAHSCEVRSTHFLVSVDRQRTPVMHAATGYYVLNLDITAGADVSVTAEDPITETQASRSNPFASGFGRRGTMQPSVSSGWTHEADNLAAG